MERHHDTVCCAEDGPGRRRGGGVPDRRDHPGRGHAGADAGGAIQLTYSVSFTARTGFLGLVARGAESGRPAATRLYVVPLRPWATASAYAVYAGQQVRIAVHGFAAREPIVVREETAAGRLAMAWTDDGGNGALGPLTVPPHEQRPAFDVVGARNGVQATVTLRRCPSER